MGNRLKIGSLFLLFAFCLLIFGFSTSQGARGQQDAKATIESGRRVFSGSCGMSYCHGSNGIGGGGPRLRDREFSAEYLTKLINDGIPGTIMPAFKSNLKKEQISDLVAFLLSINTEVKRASQIDPHLSGSAPSVPRVSRVEALAKTAPTAAPVRAGSDAAELGGVIGDAAAGQQFFFDAAQLTNCRICHTVQGRGGQAASDLGRLSDQSPREIFQRILAPHASLDGKYGMVAVTLKSGEHITGIARDEDETSKRIYDTSSLPPVSRNLLKSEIAKTEKLATSGCPGNYASKLTLKQLLDLVAFLKTTDLAKPASVSLKEIF